MRKTLVVLAVLLLASANQAPGATPQYVVTDLGTLGGTESWAYGINSSGQTHAFLLTPTPEPSTLALLAVGFATFLVYSWRRKRRAA